MNPELFGPGPILRRPTQTIARGPPLRGLVITACTGLAVSLFGGLIYKFAVGDPGIKKIEKYYEENPSR